jgi:Fe-S-cluster-containing hydrogenase component 2
MPNFVGLYHNTTTVQLSTIGNPACASLCPFGAIWYCSVMFLKMFHICKNRSFDTLCVHNSSRGF